MVIAMPSRQPTEHLFQYAIKHLQSWSTEVVGVKLIAMKNRAICF